MQLVLGSQTVPPSAWKGSTSYFELLNYSKNTTTGKGNGSFTIGLLFEKLLTSLNDFVDNVNVDFPKLPPKIWMDNCI